VDLENIKIGQGLGCLIFGMKPEEIECILGEPEIKNHFKDDQEDYIEWHFESEKIYVYFDAEDDFRLSNISCERLSCKLLDQNLIGETYNKILRFLENSHLGSFKSIPNYLKDDENSVSLIECSKACINFWFEDNQLQTIQFGPQINNEDQIIWPSNI
jgi:hypothetical protein